MALNQILLITYLLLT